MGLRGPVVQVALDHAQPGRSCQEPHDPQHLAFEDLALLEAIPPPKVTAEDRRLEAQLLREP